MNKVTVSIIGQDRPGILSAVTEILHEQGCNLENVSQTILQGVFGALFIVSIPDDKDAQSVKSELTGGLSAMQLHVFVTIFAAEAEESIDKRPYVITTLGPDKTGLVAAISSALAAEQVNITNLRAVFKGGKRPVDNIMIFEVDVPASVDMQILRSSLAVTAKELGLDINIQHRKIFEKINRI